MNLEDYFMRKGNYAIKGLSVCDDTAKITLIEMVWPGSVHDNWVWSSSDWMEDNMETEMMRNWSRIIMRGPIGVIRY